MSKLFKNIFSIKIIYVIWFVFLALPESTKAQDLARDESHDFSIPSFVNCGAQVNSLLNQKSWRAGESWTRRVDKNSMTLSFRRSTRELGSWVDLDIPEEGAPTVKEVSAQKAVVSKWSSECKMEKSIASPIELSDLTDEGFSDNDLQLLINAKKKVLIYIWSPSFVYSAGAIASYARAARNKGFEFIALLDPRASENFAKAKLIGAKVEHTLKNKALRDKKKEELVPFPAGNHTRKMLSLEILRSNGFNHFPVAYIVSDGRFNPRPIIGVLSTSSVEEALGNWPMFSIKNPFLKLSDFYKKSSLPPLALKKTISLQGKIEVSAGKPKLQAENQLIDCGLSSPEKCTQAFTYLPMKGSWVKPDERGRVSLGYLYSGEP